MDFLEFPKMPPMKPEGIILFHIAGNFGFKRTLEKDDQPKSLAA